MRGGAALLATVAHMAYRLQQVGGAWATPKLTAQAIGPSERTVRTWMRQGVISERTHARRAVCNWTQALRESESRARRCRA